MFKSPGAGRSVTCLWDWKNVPHSVWLNSKEGEENGMGWGQWEGLTIYAQASHPHLKIPTECFSLCLVKKYIDTQIYGYVKLHLYFQQEHSKYNTHACACMISHFSHVWLFATLWTIACQAPLSTGFSRQEYWSGLPGPSQGDLPNPGIESRFYYVSCNPGGFFTTSATWEALISIYFYLFEIVC